eukprot:COSAG02_NODE_2625_length_8397_cov_2.746806_2_plen_545_part_00
MECRDCNTEISHECNSRTTWALLALAVRAGRSRDIWSIIMSRAACVALRTSIDTSAQAGDISAAMDDVPGGSAVPTAVAAVVAACTTATATTALAATTGLLGLGLCAGGAFCGTYTCTRSAAPAPLNGEPKRELSTDSSVTGACDGQRRGVVVAAAASRRRRHKLVRDLEWVWLSPSIFSHDLEGCAGLCDSTCAAIAADPRCTRWLDQLDAIPAPLIEHLGHDPALPLGFYFAKLLEFWLRCCPALEVPESSLSVNQPITTPHDGKTVGQLKYIFRRQTFRSHWDGEVRQDSAPGCLSAPVLRLHHWEASVKFFLRAVPTHKAATPQIKVPTEAYVQTHADSEPDKMCSSSEEVGSCGPDSTAGGDGGCQRALRRAAGGSDPSKLAKLLEANEWDGRAIDETADGSGIDSNCAAPHLNVSSILLHSVFERHWRDDTVGTSDSNPCTCRHVFLRQVSQRYTMQHGGATPRTSRCSSIEVPRQRLLQLASSPTARLHCSLPSLGAGTQSSCCCLSAVRQLALSTTRGRRPFLLDLATCKRALCRC